MFLDIRTLVFNLLLFTLVFAVGQCLLQRSQPRVRGLYWWAAANGTAGLAFLLTSLRDLIPDFLSIIVANDMLLLALCFFHEGVARLRGYTWLHWWICPVLLAIMTPVLMHYTYTEPNMTARIVATVLISKLPTLLTIGLLIVDVPPKLRIPHWFTASGFIMVALVSMVRAIHAIFYPSNDLMAAGPMQMIGFLSIFLLLVIATFGCVWMVASYLAEELERQARTDALTGTMNRLALDESLARELKRVQRDGQPLSLLLFDLDHFKELNDRLGHQHGDAALKLVAKLTRQELRASDLLARYGGEEFLVVLPGTDKRGALKTAERLRSRLENQAIARGNQAVLTSSYGISSFPEDGVEAAELIGRADAMLYAAKQGGRNSVVAMWPEETYSTQPLSMHPFTVQPLPTQAQPAQPLPAA